MAKTTSKNRNSAAARGKSASGTGVSPEERWRMIAEAAYYRALRRGFSDGDPVTDWLTAEREIDGRLMQPERQTAQTVVPTVPGRPSAPGAASRHTVSSH